MQRTGAVIGLIAAVLGIAVWVVSSVIGAAVEPASASIIFVIVIIAAALAAQATSWVTPLAFLVAAICGGAIAATLGATTSLSFFALCALGAVVNMLGLKNASRVRAV